MPHALPGKNALLPSHVKECTLPLRVLAVQCATLWNHYGSIMERYGTLWRLDRYGSFKERYGSVTEPLRNDAEAL